MKTIDQKDNATLKKIAWVHLLLILGITSTFCQETKPTNPSQNYEKEWWFPVIQKLKIDLKSFTAINNFKTGSTDSTRYSAVEMGNNGVINGRIMKLERIICVYKENNKEYNLVTAEFATHDMDMKQVKWTNGKMEVFSLGSEIFQPKKSISFDELQIDFETNKALIKNISGTITK
jgi:hypothetical protein